MKNTDLNTKAIKLKETTVKQIEINKTKVIDSNSLSTTYLSECYSAIKDITVQKEMFKAIRDFKNNLLKEIKDDEDKVLNTVLLTLNTALKNSNINTINLLKLNDFSVVSKFSKLSNNNQKQINNTKDLSVDTFAKLVTELQKKQNKETEDKKAIKRVSKLNKGE